MIVLRFKVQVQPDKIDQALEVFAAVPPPSREVDGVVSFDIGRDVNDPNAIIATEVFEDEAARERQEALPEVAAVMRLLPEIAAAPPEATVFQVA
jgi:quinol monooxygenase YgiN